MSADALASSSPGPILSTAATTISKPHPVKKRLSIGSFCNRGVRFLGQSFLGMPSSTWLLIDLAVLVFCINTAHNVFPPYELLVTPHILLWQTLVIFSFTVIISSLVFGLYERETLMSRSRILTRMMLTASTATILSYAIIYVIMYSTVSRRMAGLSMAMFFFSGALVRLIALYTIKTVHRGLLVVGSRNLYDSFKKAQDIGLLSEYRLIGYSSIDNASDVSHSEHHLGRVVDQIPHLAKHRVTDIVVGADAADDSQVMEWVVPALQAGCRVTNEAIFYEKATGQILVDEITPYWFLFADLKMHCDKHTTLKRVIDLLTSGFGLLLSVPFWPLIALAIKIGDRGPAFYSQTRVGQNGKVFKLYKFRTMRTNAENGKSIWSSPNDPRVTRVGRFLRRSRLDELPQLYNVLIGQMSIVGPRPERPDIVEALRDKLPYYDERHLVKPGLTGWAQISFRYGSTIEDAKRKLQFDLYYLKHMAMELDVCILFRTLGTFLHGAC